jgi:hypothetical protein
METEHYRRKFNQVQVTFWAIVFLIINVLLEIFLSEN